MNWTSIKDKLPESGQEAFTYFKVNEIQHYEILTYYRKGDMVEDESPPSGETPTERLVRAIFTPPKMREIEQDGFYYYDANHGDKYCKWHRHGDVITHWAELVAPDGADKEGRCVVLPLEIERYYDKEGDAVYCIIDEEITECILCYIGFHLKEFGLYLGEVERDATLHVPISAIGKTIFLTREEAEAALKTIEREGEK